MYVLRPKYFSHFSTFETMMHFIILVSHDIFYNSSCSQIAAATIFSENLPLTWLGDQEHTACWWLFYEKGMNVCTHAQKKVQSEMVSYYWLMVNTSLKISTPSHFQQPTCPDTNHWRPRFYHPTGKSDYRPPIAAPDPLIRADASGVYHRVTPSSHLLLRTTAFSSVTERSWEIF